MAPVTRTVRNIPVEVRLSRQDGLPEECVVNLDDMLTIPKRLLGERITALSSDKMALVGEAIAFTLDPGSWQEPRIV